MKRLSLLAAAIATAAMATSAFAADNTTHKSCFRSRDWQGWSAVGDGDTLYLRVNNRDIYRLDLAPGSHVRKEPGYYLVNRAIGSDYVCNAIDLDLTLADHDSGFREPVLVKSIRKLTPDEVKAIPPKDLP